MGEPPPGTAISHLVAAANEFAHDVAAWLMSVGKRGLAVLGGTLMTVILFAAEHQRGEAYSWKTAEWVLGGTLLLAFFLSWQEKYHALSTAEANLATAREPKSPYRFTAYIINLQLIGKLNWYLVKPGVPAVFAVINLRIKNLGADSLTEDWRVSAAGPSGEELVVDVLGLDNEKFDVEFADGRAQAFEEEHCIYMRARGVIPSGGGVDGVLICHINDVTLIQQVDPASIGVAFNDVAGNEWKADKFQPDAPKDTPLFYYPTLPGARMKKQS